MLHMAVINREEEEEEEVRVSEFLQERCVYFWKKKQKPPQENFLFISINLIQCDTSNCASKYVETRSVVLESSIVMRVISS